MITNEQLKEAQLLARKMAKSALDRPEEILEREMAYISNLIDDKKQVTVLVNTLMLLSSLSFAAKDEKAGKAFAVSAYAIAVQHFYFKYVPR